MLLRVHALLRVTLPHPIYFLNGLLQEEPAVSTSDPGRKTLRGPAEYPHADKLQKVLGGQISKKEGGRKRIPGVIDYFLKFKEKEEVQEKKSYLKRRKIAR